MDGAFLLDKMPRFPGRKVEVETGDAGEGTCSIWKSCEELLLGGLELGEFDSFRHLVLFGSLELRV